MRVISLNANGIRAALRKGLESFLETTEPDILCLQELKAHAGDIPDLLTGCSRDYHCAEKKGYSGVGILSRQPPERIVTGMGLEEYDREGRVLRADFKEYSVLSVYVPSGSSKDERQAYKMRFLESFYRHTQTLLAEGRELIICGDFNIAHQKVDLTNWQANQTTSGFLPEERDWFSRYLELGLIDAYRQHIGAETVSYSWWSLRTGARARNVGWRLDYQLTTPALAARVQAAAIPREPKLSDHAPVVMDYREA